MPSRDNGVKALFDRMGERWESRYSHRNKLVAALNRLFRRALFERFRLTFERCGEVAGARVLDIGCGTGLYSIEFARRGASRVVGIDFAPAMIKASQAAAKQAETGSTCEFVNGDFMDYPWSEKFDIVVAMGLFDYIAEPLPALRRIASLTDGTFLASFPSGGSIWRLQRKIRYDLIKRCPVHHYTEPQLTALFPRAGFSSADIIRIGQGLFVEARCSSVP